MRVPMNTKIGRASLTSYDFYDASRAPVDMPGDFPVIRCSPSRFDEWRFEKQQDSTLAIMDVYPFGLRAAVYQFGAAQAVFISPLDDTAVGNALARWQAHGQGGFCFERGDQAAFDRRVQYRHGSTRFQERFTSLFLQYHVAVDLWACSRGPSTRRLWTNS